MKWIPSEGSKICLITVYEDGMELAGRTVSFKEAFHSWWLDGKLVIRPQLEFLRDLKSKRNWHWLDMWEKGRFWFLDT